MAKILIVDKSRARTPWEEYWHLHDQLSKLGNYFIWDAHPNQIAMDERIRKRINKKLCNLVDSEEFQHYHPWHKL